jgi:ABC-type spermidine/putrescine transport system permease subunit II
VPLPESLPKQRLNRALDRGLSIAGRMLLAVTLAFLLAPAIIVIILSFSNAEFIAFPPPTWGMRQYRTLLESQMWLDAIWLSTRLAVPTAILSALIAVPAAYAIYRTSLPGRSLLSLFGLLSLIVPISAYAVAMYGLYVLLGLLGTKVGIILAHTVLAFPLVLIIVTTALSRIPRELELVAMTLGASRLRAWIGITGRLLIPALVTGFIFAFLASFDEAVFINFLGGPGLVTLPKAIFDSVRFGIDPVITAIATLLIFASAVVVGIASWLERRA